MDLHQEPLRGYVRRHEDGHIEFEALDEKALEEGPLLSSDAPPMLALSTRHGAALMLDVYPQTSGSFNFGGGNASVIRYRADTLASGIDLFELNTGHMESLSLRFPGFGAWAGTNTAVRPNGKNFPRNGGIVEFRPTRTDVAKRVLNSSLDLTVEGYWDLTNSDSEISVQEGMEIKVSAATNRNLRQLLGPLLDSQDLLSLLNRRFVVSAPSLCGLIGVRGGSPLLWNRHAMHMPGGAIRAANRRFPLVSLADLGGAAGLARWSKLREEHPVVIDSVTTPYRSGADTYETAIVRVASAIELFVASHKKTTAWAKVGAYYSESLARRVGAPFEKWVGPVDKWSEKFNAHYNATKHHTSRVVDPEALRLFSITGRWLLVCSLLDRIAGTKKPSRVILGSYELEDAGQRMRAVLDNM